MDGIKRVHLCTYCDQELSHAAYYRHLEDVSGCVCPGRRELESSSSASDSSFDFDGLNTEVEMVIDTSDEINPHLNELISGDEIHSSDDLSSESDDDCEGEEIWESSDSED